MSLILSGTDGLSDIDGSAATPAIRGTDANTGIFFGTDIIGFSEGGVEAMRIDSSGNVGVGTTSPSAPIDVVSNASAIGTRIRGRSSDSYGVLEFTNNAASAETARIAADSSNNLIFSNTGSVTERMRIDSSGYLLVGTTDATKGALTVGTAAPNAAYGQICAFSPTASDSGTSGMSVVKYANDSTTAQVLFRFLINQGAAGQGQINANGANTAAFGSYSDSRLKENIVNLPSQLANIMALRPVEFDYIESMGGGHQIGFVAQEVKEIYPDLVGEDADGMYTLSDMNKNDARLIKAIQEQQALITALTTRITALEQA